MAQPELSRYSFYKGANLSAGEKQEVTRYLDSFRFIQLENSNRIVNPEREMAVHGLIMNLINWADNKLNLSLEGRIPSMDKIIFASPQTFQRLTQKYRNQGQGNPIGWHIFESGECVILERDTEEETLRIANHEIVHIFSRKDFQVKKRGYTLQIKSGGLSGYKNIRNGALKGINEIVTEMINVESLDHYRKSPDGDDYLTNSPLHYHPAFILFDMIIEEAAKRTQKHPAEIRTDLYKGYFEGKTSVLSFFEEVFGPKSLKFLSYSRPNDSGSSLLPFIGIHFGINPNQFRTKVNQYIGGEEIEILDQIKIRKRI